MHLHIQMPKIGWEDTAKNNTLDMLFLCPYISEKKYPTAIQPKAIGVNNLWWGGKKDAWKICGWKKMLQTAFHFSPLWVYCVNYVWDKYVIERFNGNFLFSDVWLTTPLNPIYSSLAQN